MKRHNYSTRDERPPTHPLVVMCWILIIGAVVVKIVNVVGGAR